MLISIDELDVSGQVSNTIIQTDQISSIKSTIIDYSNVCQVCSVVGNGVARHQYDWCVENNYLDE